MGLEALIRVRLSDSSCPGSFPWPVCPSGRPSVWPSSVLTQAVPGSGTAGQGMAPMMDPRVPPSGQGGVSGLTTQACVACGDTRPNAPLPIPSALDFLGPAMRAGEQTARPWARGGVWSSKAPVPAFLFRCCCCCCVLRPFVPAGWRVGMVMQWIINQPNGRLQWHPARFGAPLLTCWRGPDIWWSLTAHTPPARGRWRAGSSR